MSNKWLRKVEQFVVLSLLFLLPTQLAYHFWPSWAFVFGLRVDLLAPSVYLTDILIAILFLITIATDRKTLFLLLVKHKILFLLFLLFVVSNCVLSTSQPESVYKWIKLFEYSFCGYYFYKQQILKLSQIVRAIFYSVLAFSIIGFLQFFKGGTLGGVFYYLGERTFNLSTPGIALVSLNGAEHLRAYSTFSHPNSLAGYLGASILFILLSGKLKRSVFNILGLFLIVACFFVTFSVSAYLGMFFAFSFLLITNKRLLKQTILAYLLFAIVGSLTLPLVSPWFLKTFPLIGQNISQRLDLAYIAGQLISQNLLLGVGHGTFIVTIPLFKGIFSYSWLLQPVHNIFLLVLSETGIIGLLVFCYLIYKTVVKLLELNKVFLLIPLVFIVFTGLFDHYTLTLQQNSILFSLFIGISFNAKMA
jgi:O-antigen ligase